MNCKRYSIKETVQTWGGGLSWLCAIIVGWAFIGLSIQFLDELAIMSFSLNDNDAWLSTFAVLLGGSLASWCWICYRTILSPEPAWQKTLWIASFGAGVWWLGASPMFDRSMNYLTRFEYPGAALYHAAHGAAVFSLLGSIWLAHPLVQQIQWSQQKQVYWSPASSIWFNRWVLRGIAFFVVLYGGRVLLPLFSRRIEEPWNYELCHIEHFTKLLLVSVLMLIPFRVLALVNRVWFQFLVWPIFLAGLAMLVYWLWSLAPMVFFESPQRAAQLSSVFLMAFVGVLSSQFWTMNILGFRIVVPRSCKRSAVNETSNEIRVPINRQTRALAYVGTIFVLMTSLTGLTVFRNEIYLASYYVESSNHWNVSRLFAKCQAMCRAHPISDEDFAAWELTGTPLSLEWRNSIRMLVSKSLAESPDWEAFREITEQELPIRFHYVYPISNATEFAANADMPLIKFDQAKRPLYEYVRMNSKYQQIPKKLVVIGGVVTNADMDLLPIPNLEFVGCHFLSDFHWLPTKSKPSRALVFRDCTFEASSFAALTNARTQQRTFVWTDHEHLQLDPARLIDAVLNGVEVEFPNASRDWTPDWLASSVTNTKTTIKLDDSASGRRLNFALPWEFLLGDSPIPPLLSGNIRTDDLGRIVGICWYGFGKRDIPTEDPWKLRERNFEVPWLVISGQELTLDAEPRLTTLLEIIQKSRFIEFVDIVDPKSLDWLSQIDFQSASRPTIVQNANSPLPAAGLVYLPWVESVAIEISNTGTVGDAERVEPAANTDGVEVPDSQKQIIEAYAAWLPALKKLILLTDSESQPSSYEWISKTTGKSIAVELVPSKPTGTWRSSLGLGE